MDSDSLCPSPPRSEPNEVDIPREQIRRTMTILLNIFAMHPVHAYHPGRHIPLRDAVPVLSALNRSHGLTEDQVEGLGRLLSDWDRIINDAVKADTAKKAATQQLSGGVKVALSLRTARSEKKSQQEALKKVKDMWRWARIDVRTECARQIRQEMDDTDLEIKKLRASLPDAVAMAPTLKKQIREAEESLEKANQEWKALEMLLREINSSLVLK